MKTVLLEITDEMVERACEATWNKRYRRPWNRLDMDHGKRLAREDWRRMIRLGLEAALETS